MHLESAMIRLLALACPLVLAACGSAPVVRVTEVERPTHLAAAAPAPGLQASSLVTPQEVLQAAIGNVDVSAKPAADLW